MRILIVGDVHGRFSDLSEFLRQIQSDYGIDSAIQVGDFGFYRDCMALLHLKRIRFPVPLRVIDGNHEDHIWLRRMLMAGSARKWKEESNLIYQPRSTIERLGASTIGFLGGALHVDRPQQHNLLARFPNYILSHQSKKAAALFNREQPDLIVTHSCPCGIGIGMLGAPEFASGVTEYIFNAGFDAGPDTDCGETELKKLWDDLKHKPGGWVFGHFHRIHNTVIKGTRFVCVGDDLASTQHTLVLWDTDEKKLLTVHR